MALFQIDSGSPRLQKTLFYYAIGKKNPQFQKKVVVLKAAKKNVPMTWHDMLPMHATRSGIGAYMDHRSDGYLPTARRSLD